MALCQAYLNNETLITYKKLLRASIFNVFFMSQHFQMEKTIFINFKKGKQKLNKNPLF